MEKFIWIGERVSYLSLANLKFGCNFCGVAAVGFRATMNSSRESFNRVWFHQ